MTAAIDYQMLQPLYEYDELNRAGPKRDPNKEPTDAMA